MKLPDTKDDVKLIDKKGNLVKSPDYDPVAQAQKNIMAQNDKAKQVAVPNPNRDHINKQKQAKIDMMRKKLKENKAKIGQLN